MNEVSLVIAGAARSGTTALAVALDQHPEIAMCDPKEVHFFAHAEHPHTYSGPGADTMLNRPMITDPDAFAKRFGSDSTQVRAEGSVSTMAFPHQSIPALQRFASANATIVIMLREPAARARSNYQYLRARGYEACETFAAGLAVEEERVLANYPHIWRYRQLSQYDLQLPLFAEAFGDRLIVGIFEEERADLRPFLRRVCDAVGVDPSFEFRTDQEVNRGGEPRNRMFTEAVRRIADQPAVAATVKALVPHALIERIRLMNLRDAPTDADLIRELRQEFRPAVASVEAVLGRPVAAWRE